MRIYWTIESIPELKTLSKRERKRIWREAYRNSWNHWQAGAALLLLGLCVCIGGIMGGAWGAGIGGGIGAMIFHQIMIVIMRPYLKASVIQEHDVKTESS